MPDLTGTTYALVGAAASTSYVLFSNVGLSQLGPIALLNGRVAPVTLSAADKVRLWSGYFFPAARWSIGGTAVGLLLNVFVYRSHPNACVGKLALASGLIGACVVPYTVAFIGPTNKELIALNRDDAAALKDTQSSARVDELIKTWESRHIVRYVAFLGAWGLAMAALVLDGRV